MHTHTVEPTEMRSRALHCCTLVREGLTRGYLRGMQASVLLSEFCTVQVLEGPKNMFALRNRDVSAFQGL